jgi:hypothetical protein
LRISATASPINPTRREDTLVYMVRIVVWGKAIAASGVAAMATMSQVPSIYNRNSVSFVKLLFDDHIQTLQKRKKNLSTSVLVLK